MSQAFYIHYLKSSEQFCKACGSSDRLSLGLAKKCIYFFHKIKDTFFIFTNNIVDLAILSMSASSCMV